jgi:glucosamine kinase
VRAVLGLAGANVSGAAARLAAGLPFARARVESDAVIALRGALGTADGVTAALGTGSVFGVQRASAIRMIGGWGFQLGDQASGARLGLALCEAALLAHDGLAEGSPLLGAVLAEAGGPEGLVGWGAAARPADFAAFVPRLVAAAEAGDAAAEAIMAAATDSVAGAIDALRGGEAAMAVCFLGGLGPVYARRLAARYGAAIRAPEGTGLDGALAMARELP